MNSGYRMWKFICMFDIKLHWVILSINLSNTVKPVLAVWKWLTSRELKNNSNDSLFIMTPLEKVNHGHLTCGTYVVSVDR